MPELDNGLNAHQPQENILVNNIIEERFVAGVDPINDVEINELKQMNDFIFDEDDEAEEARDREEAEERWHDAARVAMENGLMPPPLPEHLQINPDPNIVFPQPQRVRRGGRAIVEDGKHIPAGLQENPRRNPVLRNVLAGAPAPVYKAYHKKATYVAEGVQYKGYTFSRELNVVEKQMLALIGYHDLIKRTPDLAYAAKEMPIDDTEECVVLLSELADYLAEQACKRHIVDFDIKEHTMEYQTVYKRYLKEISSFKRPKNGQ